MADSISTAAGPLFGPDVAQHGSPADPAAGMTAFEDLTDAWGGGRIAAD